MRVSLPHPYLLIFPPLSYFAPHSTNSTRGIGYDYKQTASYTGFPNEFSIVVDVVTYISVLIAIWTTSTEFLSLFSLNKLKKSVLVVQIAINTEIYVTTSTTILNSFYSVYIHLLKFPPQSHSHSHCPPLFSLQDV